MIRLGTVGTSAICQFFLDGVALTKEFKLSAVYSRNAENGMAFGLKNGCKTVFCDLEQMAKSGEIDAVYIATPNSLHFSQCKTFLENGIHVICEKPIVTCGAEYEALRELADSKGLIFMEAIIPRYVSQYLEVKNAIGKLGKIQMARIDFCQRSSRLDSFIKGESVNIFDMSLKAGCLMDIGIYCVYAALDLLGVPKSVKADCSLLYNGADGSGSAILNYDDFIANLTYSKTCDGSICSEIIGENGTLKIGKISQYTAVTLIMDGKETTVCGELSKAELMQGEAQRFADYILRFDDFKQFYENDLELALNVHKTMDLIKENAGILYPEL